TNCSGRGTVSGTVTDMGYGTADIDGTVHTHTNCDTTYTPPKTDSGNWITVDNAAWVTDVKTGDEYLIKCTAGWVGSKCSYLNSGTYKAELKGNNMWITGMKGMKEMTAKYHVLQYVRNSGAASPIPVSTGTTLTSSASSTVPSSLNADESYAWKMYGNSLPEDKDYVQVFCSGNPKGAALLPRAKVIAGQGPEHALDCASWISAKAKNNNEPRDPGFDASNYQRNRQITGGT